MFGNRMVGACALLCVFALACGDDAGDGTTTVGDAAAPVDSGAMVDMAEPGDDAGPPDLGQPDLGPPPCEAEGATRVGSCGNCGMQQQTCTAGIWGPTSDCLSEGECAPGALDQEATDMCGERQRLCSAECAWNDWSTTIPDGECAAGASRTTGDGCPTDESKDQTCSSTCEWADDTTCESVCGPLRTSPMESEEVCVPAGPFIRGDDLLYSPSGTVMMSAYVIDRYPVTFRRYRACRAAGACLGELSTAEAEARVDDAAYQDFPVRRARHAQATAFCAWDGGRHLTTEAEWEKAVRGPAPRANVYAYGDAYVCSNWPDGSTCGDRAPYAPIGSYPAMDGFYIDDTAIPHAYQWMSDFFHPDYFTWPSSLNDPMGPAGGTNRVYKDSIHRGPFYTRISNRYEESPVYGGAAFRCARRTR